MIRRATSFLITFGCLLGLGLITPSMADAQMIITPDQDEPVTDARKAEIIDSVAALVNRMYVFPDVAKKMETAVRKKLKAGGYKEFGNMMPFMQALHKDMRDICKDGHFGLMFDPNPKPAGEEISPEMEKAYLEEERRNNYGFKKLEILPGNIGYLNLLGFTPSDIGGATAVAAMNFLGNSDALIIDLRDNGGGDPSMIQLISSYFFKNSVHLNSFEERGKDTVQQFWTSLGVQGKKLVDAPIYLLTSNYTFSAAEEFSYNLKNLKRATIVGENTGGGAHPVNGYAFPNLKVSARVPYARAINPITGTNWEGVGVKPDIEVSRDKALAVAHLEALEALEKSSTDDARKREYRWQADRIASENNPLQLAETDLAGCAGKYGPRLITVENGRLYSQREGGPKFELIPMTRELFRFGGNSGDYLRLRFQRDTSGSVTGVIAIFQDGREEPFPRQSAN